MTSEEKLKTIGHYQNKKGAILKDGEAVQVLSEVFEYAKDAADWLGYSDSRDFKATALERFGVMFKAYEYSKKRYAESRQGPIDQWPVEEVDAYYSMITRAANRSKDIYITTDSDEIQIDAYSDMHVGSPDVDWDLFKQCLQKSKEDDAWLIFGGDNLNTSISQGVGSEGLQIELPLSKCLDLLEHVLHPFVPRIAFIDEGNHEERIKKKLGIAYSPALELCKRQIGRASCRERV